MLNLGTAHASIEVRLDKLEAGLADAQRKFAASGKQLDATAAKIKRDLSQSFGELGRTLTIGLTAPLAALGTAAIKAAVDMDSLKRGLRAVAGSSQETERQLVRLREVAKLPGLGFKEAIQGATTLQAAGLSANMAERALKGFGNALATVGKGKADLDGVIRALSQIESKGKITAEEINQLAERVPQIRVILKEAFGTADTEVLQKAKIGTKEFFDAVIGSLEKMPKVVGGAQNSFENFSDSAQQALAKIGDVFLPAVTKALDAISPILEKIAAGFADLPGPAQTALGMLAIGGAIMGPALLGMSTLINSIKSIGTAWAALPAGLLRVFGGAAIPLAAGGAAIYGMATLPTREEFMRDHPELFEQSNKDPKALAKRRAFLQEKIANFRKNEAWYQRNYPRQRFAELAGGAMRMEEELAGLAPDTGQVRGGGRIDAAARAAAAEARKKAAEDAKRIAEERRELQQQLAVDMATFDDKFKGLKTKAFQDFVANQAKFGTGGLASDIYKQALREIEKEEAEELKRIKANKQKRLLEIETNELEVQQAETAKRKAIIEHEIEVRKDLFKTLSLNSMEAEREMMRAAGKRELDALKAEIEEMEELRRAMDDLTGAPVGIGAPRSFWSTGTMRKIGAPGLTEAAGKSLRGAANAEKDRGFDLGQSLAVRTADGIYEGFSDAIDRLMGRNKKNPIGRILSSVMSDFINSALNDVIKSVGKGGKGIGGLGTGSIIGAGLGILGSVFGFAEGGWVPGRIGQPQPAIVHGGEFVVSRKMQEQGAMGGVTVNFGGVTVAGDYDVDRMMDRIAWAAKNRLAVNPGTA
jgi:tape measure domain-containing protein